MTSDGIQRSAYQDAQALPVLLRAMEAAGQKDLTGFLSLLDEAASHLPPRRHKAYPTIAAAQEYAQTGQWDAAWGAAHQATADLTFIFPPDISMCPPAPSARVNPHSTCTACGQPLPQIARFCSGCGTPTG